MITVELGHFALILALAGSSFCRASGLRRADRRRGDGAAVSAARDFLLFACRLPV